MNAVTPSLTLVRRFRAAPERVWEAWTTPEVIALWFGPHHTRVESARVALHPGGELNVVLREDNGERHETRAVFEVIEAPRRLVLAWSWASTPERVSRLTVVLRAVEEGTELTLTHDRFADETTATNHRRGWTEALERLLARLG
ncbi:MAG TPA: SRPBCC domain-containing protein [Roseococcus sp.]|jgi:uncharacterized protein YndB with AHSA1/START domain|nr:SRPBCC domain-containing protein [Roseococcus sp.]